MSMKSYPAKAVVADATHEPTKHYETIYIRSEKVLTRSKYKYKEIRPFFWRRGVSQSHRRKVLKQVYGRIYKVGLIKALEKEYRACMYGNWKY